MVLGIQRSGGTQFFVAPFGMKKKPTSEETLFKHSPDAVKALRRQAKKEKRAKERKEWYARNSN